MYIYVAWQTKESIDAAIGDVISKPWLPLPLGLKPPALDSVMVELQRQGIPKIPPSYAYWSPNIIRTYIPPKGHSLISRPDRMKPPEFDDISCIRCMHQSASFFLLLPSFCSPISTKFEYVLFPCPCIPEVPYITVFYISLSTCDNNKASYIYSHHLFFLMIFMRNSYKKSFEDLHHDHSSVFYLSWKLSRERARTFFFLVSNQLQSKCFWLIIEW